MDFHALPRRDLQALCKRNGVRANMTNVAMADALRALPTVDGIEEYVMQPVAVPEPSAADEEEPQKLETQGCPLPRGRRATAKPSEPIKPDEGKEEEKGEAKRQSNKENVVVGRRGASRRARPSPVVAAPAAESDGAGAAEEPSEKQGSTGGGEEASMDDVPALGVGLRRCSRRAPAVIAPATEEEQRAPIPRGCRVKAKPIELIRLDDSDDEETENMKPEKEEDAPALGVGRRVGSRRARAALAVAEPTGKAEEEPRAPISRGCCVKSKQTELISLDESEEEEKENKKPEKEEVAPAIGVGRRGGSRRAPAHVEAPATRSTAATGKTEARDVVTEAVPIRPTRQRMLTMKAAAAAEDQAPRRALTRGSVRKTLLQPEEQEKPQGAVSAPVSDQGCDGSEDIEQACGPQNEELIEVVDASKQEDRGTRQRKLTTKAAAAAEDKAPRRATMRGAVRNTLLQHEEQEEPQSERGAVSAAAAVFAPVSDQGCDGSEVLEQPCGPQNEELNEAVHALTKEDQDLVIIQDEVLMEENPVEESLVTDQECRDRSTPQEHIVDVEKCPAPLASQEDSPILGFVSMSSGHAAGEDEGVNFQESIGSSEGLLVKKVCEFCDAVEEIEIVPVVQLLQATLISEASTEEVIAGEASHKKEISEVGAEDDIVSQQKDDLVDEAIFLDCSGSISQFAGEVTNEINTEDGFGCQKKGDVVANKVLPDTVDEMQHDIATMVYGVVDHFETDVVRANELMEVVTTEVVPELTGADGDVVWEKKTPLIVDEPQRTVTMDEDVVKDNLETDIVHADEQLEMVTTDDVPEFTRTDGEVVGEKKTLLADSEVVGEKKKPLIVDEPQRTVTMLVKDNLETDIVHADDQMEMLTKDEVPEFTRTDGEVVGEKKTPPADYEKQQIMVTINGDVDDHSQNDVAHADELVEEEKATVITADMPNITHTMDVWVKESHFGHDNEEKKAITSDIEEEVSRTEDGDDLKDNALTSHLPQELYVAEDSNGHIAPAMLDDLTESKSIITVEPSVLTAEDTSVCKSSSEKNATEPVAVQEENAVKVVQKSVDYNGLSLGRLRAELKKKLNAKKNKEAKRVALARVDENICRSHAKGQQLNLNLQPH
ncbi:hypothetical protein U9M48_033662 [Paspalum notatum var. saurae]|uniref:Uncharacterized protein n=1 Tax=Paspalum notatum var. saurae TaxID=547442 RepID=A0AAQ3X6X5_PASNO